MDREELIQSLIEKMRSVMKGIHGGHGFPFGKFTLNMPQVRILFFLAKKEEGLSVKEIAEMLSVTPGAVTQFVDALVEKDLVTRKEDPNDRRIFRIRLSKIAQGKFERFRKDYFASASRIFGILSDEELRQLNGLLAKLKDSSGMKEYKK